MDVEGLFEPANGRPIVFENDMHALAVRWLLTHQAEQTQDVLLVYIGDGRLGAAVGGWAAEPRMFDRGQ